MNAVEIEEAISLLAEQPFDAKEFPYLFLEAFGNKEATIKRLKSGVGNDSDIAQGVLQRQNIHIATCQEGKVSETLIKLRKSPASLKGKVKFILATDGRDFEAEDLTSDDAPIVCQYLDFPNYFGFFLALAGISTVKQIRESSFDIRATSRLNRLYIELLQNNPDWGISDRRHDMNHFLARLIFCFFAEDTDIFNGKGIFTKTIEQISARDSSDSHEVISEIFRSMNTKPSDRASLNIKRWADNFPYVNGGLFSGNLQTPRFSKIARSYLIHVGKLDWTKINPDIFGSMIQAVADEDEREELGMHYTSVPNILKVLNPLFLDSLRNELDLAENNLRKLLNLRKRMSRIRIFDPACGSGNFLVIAYKQMREIENEINSRRNELHLRSEIPLTNFRGIELRDFSAEVARLALIIAEYQCDVLYRGQKEALAEFLPLESQNWITSGNALKIDWLKICPPTGESVKFSSGDLFGQLAEQTTIDFENEGGETYICGNPPFSGSRKQTKEQKDDLKNLFEMQSSNWKNIDYVGAWFWKAAEYNKVSEAPFCFVATNSLCQGQQVGLLWQLLLNQGFKIRFAHLSFKWKNLASHNAAVTVIAVAVDNRPGGERFIFEGEIKKTVEYINPYLNNHKIEVIQPTKKPISEVNKMEYGIYYSKSSGLMLTSDEKAALIAEGFRENLTRSFVGSSEFISGKQRYCLWLEDEDVEYARTFKSVSNRLDEVERERLETKDVAVQRIANRPHQFREKKGDNLRKLFIPIHTSENRDYLPIGLLPEKAVVPNSAFALYDAPLWNFAILSSKLHIIWIATVCGKIKTDFRYSNTLGWNTYPLPKITSKNKEDLTKCAEDILLAREANFPESIADLYDPEKMPENLRYAHDQNDEILERIYIGRRFKNDTERLEKLFEFYTKMSTQITKVSEI